MAFTKKNLSFSFTYASGSSLSVSGLRAVAKVAVKGGAGQSSADVAIFGMTLSQMNQLTTFGTQITQINNNVITISAGENGKLSQIFKGKIREAYMDANNMPEVVFRVHAESAIYEAVKTPSPPTSVQGTGDVKQMMSNIAQQMGFQFSDNGVNVKLDNPYFPGSLLMQAQQLAQAANIHMLVDNGTLSIWPPNSTKTNDQSTLISKDTIMIGYPTFSSIGVNVLTLFDPTIQFGNYIQVQSDIQPACGRWKVLSLDYDLSCELPKGPWYMMISTENANAGVGVGASAASSSN